MQRYGNELIILLYIKYPIENWILNTLAQNTRTFHMMAYSEFVVFLQLDN